MAGIVYNTLGKWLSRGNNVLYPWRWYVVQFDFVLRLFLVWYKWCNWWNWNATYGAMKTVGNFLSQCGPIIT